jgi:hypothetical protein
MEQAVEDGGCHHGVAEHGSPLADRAITGDQHAAPLVAPRDELEEQMRRTGLERQVAELIDDQQSRFAEVSKAILEPTLAMRLGELGHQSRRRHEQHRIAGQGIVNLDGRGMLVVSVARRLGSEGPLLAYCADPL